MTNKVTISLEYYEQLKKAAAGTGPVCTLTNQFLYELHSRLAGNQNQEVYLAYNTAVKQALIKVKGAMEPIQPNGIIIISDPTL
jgi:hypothetical protein